MDLFSIVKDQFLDVIEYEDKSNKLIVYKFQRESGNNELKQGSKVVVREGQTVAFLKGGVLADILSTGTYTLNTGNFPILSKLKAFPYMFTSPVIADVYFISTKQFVDYKWATKSEVIKRDKDMGVVRLRSFGKFSFRITSPVLFMREVFGSQGKVTTYDIADYLSSMVTETCSSVLCESEIPVIELTSKVRLLAMNAQCRLNSMSEGIGITFSNIIIEGISLPNEVEKAIDEQSSIGLMKRDMTSFMQYQTAKAMRDAANQDVGIMGLGVGAALGNTVAKNISLDETEISSGRSISDQLRELKGLLDDGILTQEEFDNEKKIILSRK